MARWMLRCNHCDFVFEHSYIEDSGLLNSLESPKPEFPQGGIELECPNCGQTYNYIRIELVYYP
jgi:uncharacterized C2H2 Zn-finger protein